MLSPESGLRKSPLALSDARSDLPYMSPQNSIRTADSGQDTTTAMILMIGAMLWLPTIDALAKTLSTTVPSGQIAWSRFLFQTLFLLPFLLLGRQPFRRPRYLVHAARGGLIALATLLFFSALKTMPLAETIAIFFVEPLILTLLSVVFLKEPIGWRRLSAVSVGFIGALIVIRPSYENFGYSAILPLGAALAFASYLLLTRNLAQKEGAVPLQLVTGVFGGLIMSVALFAGSLAEIDVLDPVWPTAFEWLLLAGVGVVATTGHLLVVHAFRRAQAAILAPFQYLEIISATFLGLVIFGDFPDLTTWFGVSVIVGSGIYVFYRERKVARLA